ncbi:MAG: universal stress protein [Pedobacter sp.]|nr:MAG: universal stress protein [Pedobacter sp.]
MMEKILIATDLSSNSASAIRFALALARSRNVKLIIVHVYHIRKPNNWRMHRYETYLQIRKLYLNVRLKKFLDKIFSDGNENPMSLETEILMNISVISTLINTALAQKVSYICISAKGSGKSENKFGSISSKLIVKAPIPVICIPSTYRVRPIEEVCYATDLYNYQKEIQKVVDFARPLLSAVKMLQDAILFQNGNLSLHSSGQYVAFTFCSVRKPRQVL